MLKYFIVSVHIILALFIFQHGFLLKRQEIVQKSSCSDAKGDDDSCWMKPQYKRVVLVLVDALRYDFLFPSDHCGEKEETKYCCGKMKYVSELFNNRSLSIGILIADPPTTTIQRLKAVTTGTLPTFIDAGDNFSSDFNVKEDNFLYQAKESGRNMTLLGDDTWISLYPNVFSRTAAYDSFDINDLNTVDDKVIPLLQDEIDNSNSSLIIAHFLGVDHCGHKFGSNHPVMTDTLRKMDKMLENTIKSLRDDDLLLVFGDHGMTLTGDHGGDSTQEVYAGFFAYSKNGLIELPKKAIYQIDLVPTISLLLGIPIPFSNLGTVITSMFPENLRESAVAMNYEQVKRFAEVYSRQNNFAELHNYISREANTMDEQLNSISQIQTSLRVAWTQFDNSYINVGILLLIEAYFFILSEQELTVSIGVFRSGCILLQCALLWDNSKSSAPAITLLMMALSVSCLSSMFKCLANSCNHVVGQNKITPNYIANWGMVIHSISMLSNSFIIYEAKITRFFIQSVLVWSFFSCFERTKRNIKIWPMLKSILEDRKFYLLILSLCFLRFESYFHRCREEEIGCIQYDAPLVSALLPKDTKLHRIVFSIFCMIAFNYLIFGKVFRNEKPIFEKLAYPLILVVSCHMFYMTSGNNSDRANWLVIINLVNSLIISLFAGESKLYFLLFPIYILLGDGLIPAIMCLVFILYSCFQIVPYDTLPPVISLFITYGFYLTGHSPTLPTIPWNAGFIGISGQLALRVLPAILILSHLNISSIISAVVVFIHEPKISNARCVSFQLMRSIMTCVAASIHRRHLMVWKIFAPKFIFENVSFIVFLVVSNILKGFQKLRT